MWRQYCLLPSGNATEAVIELTRMRYDDNIKLQPVHAAPDEWVDKVISTVEDMAEASREDGEASKILLTGGIYKTSEDKVLKTYRELALWLLSGPWRGERQRLGVLAEVLGLEVKGTYWAGLKDGPTVDDRMEDTSEENIIA
jgi:hypothetical protein